MLVRNQGPWHDVDTAPPMTLPSLRSRQRQKRRERCKRTATGLLLKESLPMQRQGLIAARSRIVNDLRLTTAVLLGVLDAALGEWQKRIDHGASPRPQSPDGQPADHRIALITTMMDKMKQWRNEIRNSRPTPGRPRKVSDPERTKRDIHIWLQNHESRNTLDELHRWLTKKEGIICSIRSLPRMLKRLDITLHTIDRRVDDRSRVVHFQTKELMDLAELLAAGPARAGEHLGTWTVSTVAGQIARIFRGSVLPKHIPSFLAAAQRRLLLLAEVPNESASRDQLIASAPHLNLVLVNASSWAEPPPERRWGPERRTEIEKDLRRGPVAWGERPGPWTAATLSSYMKRWWWALPPGRRDRSLCQVLGMNVTDIAALVQSDRLNDDAPASWLGRPVRRLIVDRTDEPTHHALWEEMTGADLGRYQLEPGPWSGRSIWQYVARAWGWSCEIGEANAIMRRHHRIFVKDLNRQHRPKPRS